MQMPTEGRDWIEVREEMVARGGKDVDWRSGRTAVYVFNAGEDILHVQKEAYALYMSENGLGPLAFPSLAQMEKDVIAMALGLLHGPGSAVGGDHVGRNRFDHHGDEDRAGFCAGKRQAADGPQYRAAPLGPPRFRQGGTPDGHRRAACAAEDRRRL